MSERETFITSPDCSCNCGGKTRGGWFLPGHDAKHVAWIFAMIKSGFWSADQGLQKLDVTSEFREDGASAALYNKLVTRLTKAGYTYDSVWMTWRAPSA